MWMKKRHKVVFTVLKHPFKWFFRIKYNFKPIKYKLEKKPYLILSNHLGIFDPFFVASSFTRPVYYIATADLFSTKYGKIINYLVAPIPKNKNVKELGPIKDCIKIAKEGGTIGIFPEGNRSYDGNLCHIDEAIAKLAKLMKVDVVLYNLVGVYGIDPRWGYKGRRGKSYGYVKEIIKKEDVAALPNNELYDRIIKGLTVPQVPTTVKYKSNRRAECLERILYVCPICGATQTITSKKNTVKCTNCNLEVEYNKNLEFESKHPDFKFKYVEEWYKYQIDWVKNYQLKSCEDIIYTDNVRLFKVPFKERSFEILVGKIQMTKDKILFISNDLSKSKIEFKIKDITETTVQGKQKLTFYVDNETYQIKGDKGLNTLKYMHMYYHIKKLLGDNENDFMGM